MKQVKRMIHLKSPKRIGRMELKNRMVLAPMGVTVGNLKPEDVPFFLRRAEGGAAMVFCNIKASRRFEHGEHSIYFCPETEVLFREIVEGCHEYGCMVGAQIMPGDGRIGGPSRIARVPISASDCPWMHATQLKCRALTEEEIGLLLSDFRDSARAAVECGADCIEIHAYGGYLTDQFLTARWNTRTDRYGGDLEGRAQFVKELIEICKDVGGADYPVIVKFTPDHCMDEPGYRTMEEGLALAKLLEAYGADALHVDVGCHENWYRAMPPMALEDVRQYEAARQVRGVVQIPVLTNGKLGDVHTAEALLESEAFDFAVIGRGLLADPDLPNKVTEGCMEEILPCIACNVGCIGRVYGGTQATCAVNPLCGQEHQTIPKTQQTKRILVVGGGPAGCAAALFAHAAGHDVTLWEADTQLGGKLTAAAAPKFKRGLARLSAYYRHALAQTDVKVELGRKADAASVADFAADAVLWAVGCADRMPQLTAAVPVVTAAEALMGAPVGQRVLVLGGGVTAIETALHFDAEGHTVTCAARGKLPSKPEFRMNDMLLRRMMSESSVTFLTGMVLMESADGLHLRQGDTLLPVACDTIISAMGGDGQSLVLEKVPVVPIGDALGAGTILQAVHSAWNAVRGL